ncbi:MAG: hypothetical protein U1D30_18565 [Planctomycetota bacterium]
MNAQARPLVVCLFSGYCLLAPAIAGYSQVMLRLGDYYLPLGGSLVQALSLIVDVFGAMLLFRLQTLSLCCFYFTMMVSCLYLLRDVIGTSPTDPEFVWHILGRTTGAANAVAKTGYT